MSEKVETKSVALVVGGSRGIGRAIALRLAKSGFDICLTYRSNHEAAREVAERINSLGVRCDLLAFDIANYEETVSVLGGYFSDENPPNVVIYNAGIARDNLFVWMSKEEWDSVIHTNLDGFYNVVNSLLFSMLAAKRGRIVVIGSTSGEKGQPGQVNYSASKAGLIGAVKALAREIGRKNIVVNMVSPGLIDTEMTAGLATKKILPMIPLNRIGSVDDVAAVVDFLCKEENMYIHGQVIGVNGGLAT